MNSKKYLLIVEDDPIQLDMIKAELDLHFSGLEIEDIQTESEFYKRVDTVIANPPALILMDMMLRWADPADNMPDIPDDIDKEGYYRAGIRCSKKLHEAGKTDIPILLFTVLDKEDFQGEMDLKELDSPYVSYLPKTSSVKELIAKIKELAPKLGSG